MWKNTAGAKAPKRRGHRSTGSSLQSNELTSTVGLGSLYTEHFHHLVAKVIDDLHGDSTGLWTVERT